MKTARNHVMHVIYALDLVTFFTLIALIFQKVYLIQCVFYATVTKLS